MSVLDKVIAAVAPPDSEESRKDARAKTRAAAKGGDWLSVVLEHHEHIEAAFAAATRVAAQKKLGLILTIRSRQQRRHKWHFLKTLHL
jgi:hypothetical protein